MNYEKLAQKFLRAVRGSRSQISFARRLGYRSNVAADWEHGRRFPTALETLRICHIYRLQLASAFELFVPSINVRKNRSVNAKELQVWLNDLRAGRSIQTIAQHMNRSRFAVRRWFSGEGSVNLPSFFALIHTLTARLIDWIAHLIPIDTIPELSALHQRRQALRLLAYEEPWSEAVFLLLQTTAYASLARHQSGWIASILHIDEATEVRVLRKLESVGLLRLVAHRYHHEGEMTIDTRIDSQKLALHKQHWIQVAEARVGRNQPADLFSYNVLTCSQSDWETIEALHREYYRRVRAVVAESPSRECLGLMQISLFQWRA